MPYYSYGYGYDSANLVYLILLVPVLLLSLYAQAAVSGNFSRYSKVTNRRGLTGAQAAAGVLRAHGITDVGIARCSGKLTDHYDPRNNTIFLSDSVYDAATVAAVGVAAHEAGHAVQYAVGYGPVKLRSAIVKTTQPISVFRGYPAVFPDHDFPAHHPAGGVQRLPPGLADAGKRTAFV